MRLHFFNSEVVANSKMDYLSVLHRNLQVKYVISQNNKRYVATSLQLL